MNKTLAIFGGVVAIIAASALMLLLALGMGILSLEWKRYFNPKHANVEREVFKETRSYNEGMLQQLIDYRLQYYQSDDEDAQAAILSTVRHMYAEYDESKIEMSELRSFVKLAKYGKPQTGVYE